MDEMEKDELKKDELKTSEAPENASHEKHSDDDHDSAAAQHPDYCQELATIVRGTITPKALKEKVENYHENDIADVLSILNRAEREKLYHVLDAQTLSTVLEYAERAICPPSASLSGWKRRSMISISSDRASPVSRKARRACSSP